MNIQNSQVVKVGLGIVRMAEVLLKLLLTCKFVVRCCVRWY